MPVDKDEIIEVMLYDKDTGRLEPTKFKVGTLHDQTEGGPTEEGYDYTTRTYTYDGKQLMMAVIRETSDCDGRLEQYSEYFWSVGGELTEKGGPKWTKDPSKSTQRDYSAEAAGY